MAKAAKKSTPAKSTPAKTTPTDELIKKEQKAVEAFMGKQKSLMKAYPTLVEGDFHQYEGETLDSVQRRIAERAGVTVEELLG